MSVPKSVSFRCNSNPLECDISSVSSSALFNYSNVPGDNGCEDALDGHSYEYFSALLKRNWMQTCHVRDLISRMPSQKTHVRGRKADHTDKHGSKYNGQRSRLIAKGPAKQDKVITAEIIAS